MDMGWIALHGTSWNIMRVESHGSTEVRFPPAGAPLVAAVAAVAAPSAASVAWPLPEPISASRRSSMVVDRRSPDCEISKISKT